MKLVGINIIDFSVKQSVEFVNLLYDLTLKIYVPFLPKYLTTYFKVLVTCFV